MTVVQSALLAHAGTLLILLTLLFAAFRKKHKTIDEWVFAFFTVAMSGWVLLEGTTLALYSRELPHSFIGSIVGVFVHATAVLFYIFCEVFPATPLKGARLKRVLIISGITIAFSMLVFLPEWMKNRRVEDGRLKADVGIVFFVTGIWLVLVAAFGLVQLAIKYFRGKTREYRRNVSFILVGGVFLLIMITVFSFVLPALGIRDFYFLGTDATLLYVAILIYATLKHRLFDFTGTTIRIGLNFLAALSLSAITYLVFLTLEERRQDFLFHELLVILFVFVISMLFGRYVAPRIENVFIKSTRYEDIMIEIAQKREMQGPQTSLGEWLKEILLILQNRFGFEKAFIIIPIGMGQTVIQSTGESLEFFETPEVKMIRRILPGLRLPPEVRRALDFLDLTRESPRGMLPDQWNNKTPRLIQAFLKMLSLCRREKYRLFATMLSSGESFGYMLIGSKADGLPYNWRELRLMQALRSFVALTIRNQVASQEITWLKARAEQEVDDLTAFITNQETVRHILEDRTFVYRSPGMQSVADAAQDAAGTSHPVLITGETGTGKEIVAHFIHGKNQLQKAFVAVNCASIPPTLWEDELFGHARGAFTDARHKRLGRIAEAAGGSLFFDEIGEMPLEMQAKLLRVLQERVFTRLGEDGTHKVTCRFIFATNRDLQGMVRTGQFREDLFFRINVMQVHIPPLRERREDIPVITEFYMQKLSEEFALDISGIEHAALQALIQYNWPGNVRELENVLIRSFAVMGRALARNEPIPALSVRFLPGFLQGRITAQESSKSARRDMQTPVTTELAGNFEALLADYRRRLIQAALDRAGGNRTKAAEFLGIRRGRLHYHMTELGIK
ncbi:MAG: sigma 54-interacting transcriptional regulator [Spirochaetia bacterium]|nr:sigma 54-interacting transcriptional regulator [Spirochaetia bacterium]